jgi:DNA-binding GntR family transcriptional regulator
MVQLQKSTQELICQSIRSRIQAGTLVPGTELKQVELAKEYGVSRMPVREALQTLLLEGVVTRLSNRHMVIAQDAAKHLQGRKIAPVAAGARPEAAPLNYKQSSLVEPEGVGKIHMLPAREQVASYLRKAILRREIPEGSVLTLEETARHMGVSTTPVREALQLLASQGLVKLRPNKGAVVLGMDEKAIRDHFAVRTLLEGEAAALAARPGSDLTEVEKVYKAMRQCLQDHRYADYKHYNESFHMAVWDAADNPKLAQILGSLWNGLSLGFLMTETDYAKISFFEHEQLMEALRAHNPQKARQLMHEHMHRSMENILTNYREQVSGKK